jgi:Leucine-rich repeat (LRR) protein
MKALLLFIFSGCYLVTFAQCVDCNSFEEALKNPEQVKTLKINSLMQDITLDSVPVTIGRLVNVEILYLSDHNFSTVPKEIGNLTKLKELSFSGSKLTSLPDEIFQLKNLNELLLLNNSFTDEYKATLKERFKKELPATMLLIN